MAINSNTVWIEASGSYPHVLSPPALCTVYSPDVR